MDSAIWNEMFNNDQVTIIEFEGEFWFQVSHVCKVLGIQNPTVALQANTDEEERKQWDIGKHELVNFVSESGLYGLVFASQKPVAKEFKRWLRKMLPKLRSQGYYIARTDDETLANLQAELNLLKDRNKELTYSPS